MIDAGRSIGRAPITADHLPAAHLVLLGLRGHLLRDEFDRSFNLPPGPLGAVRQRLHGDVGLVAAGLVAFGALPEEEGRRTVLMVIITHTHTH